MYVPTHTPPPPLLPLTTKKKKDNNREELDQARTWLDGVDGVAGHHR